jgi:hypothetical protein
MLYVKPYVPYCAYVVNLLQRKSINSIYFNFTETIMIASK